MVAGSYGKSMFRFVRKCQTVFAFPPAENESSRCSTPSPAFDIVSVLDSGHSNSCVVVSHCFNLHFPDDIRCYVLVCRLCIFFGGMPVKVFSPFFILVGEGYFFRRLIGVVELPMEMTKPDSKIAVSRLSLDRFLAFDFLRTLIFQ